MKKILLPLFEMEILQQGSEPCFFPQLFRILLKDNFLRHRKATSNQVGKTKHNDNA